VAFEDPLRPEAADFVRKLQSMNVRLRLITGDHPETARAVARKLGFGAQDGALWRITPGEKKTWVDRWIAEGHRVGMTGDGVNDAPALRSAHVGIAMAKKGTDVAREAASVLLLDDDLFDLGRAIEWARGLSHQLRAVVAFLLAAHIPLVIFTLLPFLDARPEQWWLGPVQIAFLHLAIEPVAALAFPLETRADPVPRGLRWRSAVLLGGVVSVLELLAFFGLRHLSRIDPRWGPSGPTQILGLLLSGTMVLLLYFSPCDKKAQNRLIPILGAILVLWFGVASRIDADWSWGTSVVIMGSLFLGWGLRRFRYSSHQKAQAGTTQTAQTRDASPKENLPAA